MGAGGITKTLLAAAVDALEAARAVAAHAVWYLSYQVNGTTHEDEEPPARPRPKAP